MKKPEIFEADRTVLTVGETLIEANAAIRQLIERVQLVRENGELKIESYGELAALLKLGT